MSRSWWRLALPLLAVATPATAGEPCVGEVPYRMPADVAAGASDVPGRPVPPADLPGSWSWQPPAQLAIELSTELGQQPGGRAVPGLDRSRIGLGRVTVDLADGTLRLPGRAAAGSVDPACAGAR